jgi:hypothetical protein
MSTERLSMTPPSPPPAYGRGGRVLQSGYIGITVGDLVVALDAAAHPASMG